MPFVVRSLERARANGPNGGDVAEHVKSDLSSDENDENEEIERRGNKRIKTSSTY
jgi:hypothetical protein